MIRSLSRDQVRRVDELAGSRYHMPTLLLMENAGRNASAVIDRAFGPRGSALVLCGSGNNGGDGWVIARHLHNAGWAVRAALVGEAARFTPDATVNHAIASAMGLVCPAASDDPSLQERIEALQPDAIVVDALLGTGFTGQVRSPLDALIIALNRAKKRATVAIDLPSGMNCDTGRPGGVCIRADLTITFVARKVGFDAAVAKPFLGRVEVVDIGVPRELTEAVATGAAQ